MSHKYVYLFKEGNANQRELLGVKGANLAEMTNIGLPVPEGFRIGMVVSIIAVLVILSGVVKDKYYHTDQLLYQHL